MSDAEREASLQVQGRSSRLVVSYTWVEECTRKGELLDPGRYCVDFYEPDGSSRYHSESQGRHTTTDLATHGEPQADTNHDRGAWDDNDDLIDLLTLEDPPSIPRPETPAGSRDVSVHPGNHSLPDGIDDLDDLTTNASEPDSDSDEYQPTDIGVDAFEHPKTPSESIRPRKSIAVSPPSLPVRVNAPPRPKRVKPQKPVPELAAEDVSDYNWLKEVIKAGPVRSRTALFTALDETVSCG